MLFLKNSFAIFFRVETLRNGFKMYITQTLNHCITMVVLSLSIYFNHALSTTYKAATKNLGLSGVGESES